MSGFLSSSNGPFLTKFLTDHAPADDNLVMYKEYIAFDIALVTTLFTVLGVFIVVNKCKFSHVALVNTPSYPLSLKFKIILITFMIVLFVISFALSFLDQSYWMYEFNKFFGFFYLLPIIVLFLYIDWLKYQFERKIPLSWQQNQLFWSCLTVSYLFVIIICYLANSKHQRYGSPDFIISILKTINTMALMIFTFRKPQDSTDFMSDSTGLRVPLLNEKTFSLQAQKISFQTNPIKKKKFVKGSQNSKKRSGNDFDLFLLLISIDRYIENFECR